MSDEIRPSPFSNMAINKAIAKSLAEVPEGHRVAFVAVASVEGGAIVASMVVNVRIDDKWSFAGFMEGNVRGVTGLGVELRYSI